MDHMLYNENQYRFALKYVFLLLEKRNIKLVLSNKVILIGMKAFALSLFVCSLMFVESAENVLFS